jgi:hypothetical protein
MGGSMGGSMIGRSACIFYGRTSAAYNWPPASIFYGRIDPDGRTDGRVFFRKELGLELLLPLVFCFALGFLTVGDWAFWLHFLRQNWPGQSDERTDRFSMADSAWTDGRTDGRTGFLQERAEVGASPSSGFLLCAWVPRGSSGFVLCACLPLVFCFALRYQTEHWVCSGFLLCA